MVTVAPLTPMSLAVSVLRGSNARSHKLKWASNYL